MNATADNSLRYCVRLTRRAKSSFPLAFRVLPKPKRNAMIALYAFMRVTDDLADEPGEVSAKRLALQCWRQRLDAALQGEYSHRLHAALAHTVYTYGVPTSYLHDVIDGVEMDLEPVQYATFADLYPYCYRVASAVGLACVPVWGTMPGVSAEQYREPAEAAGIAFQLTNILRDLGEDYAKGRVYLPQDELAQFNTPPDTWQDPAHRDAFRAMMQFQVARARQYYDRSRALTPLLSSDGRRIFQLMSSLYQRLLDEIEHRDYDVFTTRVSVPTVAKVRLLASAWTDNPFPANRLRKLPGGLPQAGGRFLPATDTAGSPGYLPQAIGRFHPAAYAAGSPGKSHSVAVVGGGLAGLAAAVALSQQGVRVTVLESRQRLGGRAGSFVDATTGQLVDACQHVSMGCCTNLAHFCRTVGVDHLLEPQPTLYFMTPDARVSRFKSDPWRAPFHLGRALASAHYLTATEKLRVGYGLLMMLRESENADPPLLPWLLRHKQTPRTIDRFWGVVLTSALNETVERVGLKYARKVFRDGFIRHRDGFVVEVPSVPLGRLYGNELRAWLTANGVTVRENAGVKQLASSENGTISHLLLRDGSTISANYYVLAVPFDRVTDLLPTKLANMPYFANANRLSPSPITSGHLWFDRPIMNFPHVVLVDCLGQWVFNRGEVTPGEHYVQVVVSAARPLRSLGREEIQRQITDELRLLFPASKTATLLRAKVITEHTATFSAVPGVDDFRPHQASPVANLVVAGDWTQTGWPATMEGAVRSGHLAAEAILAKLGTPMRLVQPELGQTV